MLLLLAVMALPSLSFAQAKLTDEVLAQLDHELEMAPTYDMMKTIRIDSLKRLCSASAQEAPDVELYLKLAHEYETFISDSSLSYFDRAVEAAQAAGDTIMMTKARLGRIKTFGVMGYFKEGVEELSDLETIGIPEELAEFYYDSGRQLYSYMSSFAEKGKFFELYFERLDHYRVGQLNILDKQSAPYLEFLAEYYYDQGLVQRSKALLTAILDTVPIATNVYARAAANMASIKINEDSPEDAAYYLALSAISDIRCSVKENTSLQRLSLYLYEHGDIARAYAYLTASLADAVFCNTPLRTIEVSRLMPHINGAYKRQIANKQRMLIVTTIFVSLLAVALIVTILMVLKQMKRVRAARQRLKEANLIKEEYIGRFLDLCSIYMERLDNFCKVVARKITAGQAEELVKMTKSAKFAEEQHKQFYEDFDSAFLHIYPTFIDEFNSLLRPEERVEIKEQGKLTTELRIFALLRMGVDDSAKVASFLHYSINTIYAYRNKVKNKAVDREHFEENVMKIGSFS